MNNDKVGKLADCVLNIKVLKKREQISSLINILRHGFVHKTLLFHIHVHITDI